MPCTAISEGPCSAGRKANPSRHQPGILCHPCQQGCRETEYPQARSLLPPRTGSKAASAAGSAGGARGQGEWGQQRPSKRIDGKADRGNKDSRTVLSGPGVWYTGPWSVRESMQCANPTTKSPGERPRRWHRMYCLCSLHSAPASMPKDRLPRARCPRGGQRCGKGGSTGSRILRRPVPAESMTDFFELPVRRPASVWTIPPRQDFSPRRGSDTACSMAFCAHPVYKEKTL